MSYEPLAERLRPRSLDDYIGQRHLVGEGAVIRRMIESGNISSFILWGPPGVGKTTLARIIAEQTQVPFYTLSAVTSGVKDVREVLDRCQADARSVFSKGRPILFIDEIHRFNKSQQDSLLGAVERGTVTLIGATTENPSFEVIRPLLSRAQVYVLNPLDRDDLLQLLDHAIKTDKMFKDREVRVEQTEALLRFAAGDARKLLNILGCLDTPTTEFYMQLDGDNVYLLDTFGDIYAEFPMWGDCMGMMLIWSDTQNWDAFEFANHYQDGSDRPFGTLAVIVPAVPANPTADEFVDGGNEIGSTRFYFTLPETDVDGNKIDFELVSFSMWVENENGPEIFTFKADEYIYDLTEDMTEIPYEIFYGGYDFYDYLVYLYRTNAPGYEPLFTKNIGIQAHYTVDGIKNSSEIAWLYDRPVSVNEMNAGKTVANVRYYNVAGQQVAQPNGLTIQVTTFTDGTTSVAKVVK